jgi:hypothetical protein
MMRLFGLLASSALIANGAWAQTDNIVWLERTQLDNRQHGLFLRSRFELRSV